MAPGSRSTTQPGALWPVDSVKDCSEGVGIAGLSDEVTSALAGDVEYRLHEVIEEAVKFMHHSRRTTLKAEDVDHALQCRNIDPLWGFSLPTSTEGPSYLKTPTANGTIYVQEDEEIDLTKLLSLPMPSLPRQVSYTAHWLAVEGVQPAIPANPSPQDIEAHAARLSAARRPTAATSGGKEGDDVDVRPLVKHVLSRELQLYFDRLTAALLPTDAMVEGEDVENMRIAALASLRNDQGLAGLLPYLIQWAAERVATIAALHVASTEEANTLGEVALGLLQSLLENRNLFVEPYLHQLMPIILTCLINTSSPFPVRQIAASLLSHLIQRYASTYPSLKPRIVKTLLRALIEPDKMLAVRYGALLGLKGLGPAAIESVLGVKKNLRALGSILNDSGELELELARACAHIAVEALDAAFPRQPDDVDIEARPDDYGPILAGALQGAPHVLLHIVESPGQPSTNKRPAAAMEQD